MEKAMIEIKVNGEWKIWAIYEDCAMGHTPLERAERGLRTARCYGEVRLTVQNPDHGEEVYGSEN